jgi:hypothetical protein
LRSNFQWILAGAIDTAVPRAALTAEGLQIWDASEPEALTGKQADFDFRLIQPASMGGV